MGVLTTVTDTFLGMCSTLTMTVTTVTDWVAFILHINYAAVTTIYETFCDILSFMFMVLDVILQTVVIVLVYIADFLCEIYACLCALLVLVWRVLVLLYKILCFVLTGIETVVFGLWNGGVVTYQTLQQSAADVMETCESTTDYLALLAQDVVQFVCSIFTTVGNFSSAVVRGIWVGIGYVPAAIASFPSLLANWLQRLWLRCTMWTSYAFGGVTRETYLGIVICCMLYIFVSRIVCMMHARGMSLFSFRRQGSRVTRHDRGAFAVDRDFESDAEDDADNDHNDDGSDGDDGVSDDNESEAHTELTLSDNDDSDGHSGGSESDVSLNSQTFSSEESDHDIDVELPSAPERYSLRSRSSTPSRMAKKDMTHEQFEQELERERDKRKCVVCQDANKSVLILPCKHMCLCVVCANQIVRSHFIERRVCPLCRARIERVMDVFV